jgi:elongator complex protein 6
MSVRELATGAARDVSGVLRITRGGSANSDRGGDLDSDKDSEELEALYLVNRDGTVKVFERGSQR